MYHPFPLGFYFNCLGNESSLADCRATRTLSCNIDNTAGVQCAGEMIAGIHTHDSAKSENHDHTKTMEIQPPLIPLTKAGIDSLRKAGVSQYLLVQYSLHMLLAFLNHRYIARSFSYLFMLLIGCTDGGIRLIGGCLTESEGRVEICSNGVWGTVYDGGSWDNRDATVICRQLGYSSIGEIIYSTKFLLIMQFRSFTRATLLITMLKAHTQTEFLYYTHNIPLLLFHSGYIL